MQLFFFSNLLKIAAKPEQLVERILFDVILPGNLYYCSVSPRSLSAPRRINPPPHPHKGVRHHSHGKCYSKHQRNFPLISLHLRHRCYLCVLVCSGALQHRPLLWPWVGVPLSGALSSLEVTAAAPGGTGNGQCANCVGNLREPYAVC